jgi:hypothetical protein
VLRNPADELPESCIDAPGVDRHQLHALIGIMSYGANLTNTVSSDRCHVTI